MPRRPPGVRVPLVRFFVYVVAGGFYGLGGVFISAQTGSGDPLVGNPLLLSMFAAVVVGGTRLGGGRGGPIGSIFGAYILMIVVNILLVLNVSAYYSTIAESVILLLAVLAASIARDSPLAMQIRGAATRVAAWRAGTRPSQIGGGDRRLSTATMAAPAARGPRPCPSFWSRHAETLPLRAAGLCRPGPGGDRHPVLARQHHPPLGLLELADRAGELPRRPRPRPGHGDPHRRARPVGAVDHRLLRHPPRRHRPGLRRRR